MGHRPQRPWLLYLLCCIPFAFGNDDSACAGPDNYDPPIPQLTITSPTDGTFTNASSILVTGTARRGGGLIASLEVNGIDALPLDGDPQDGTWSVTVPLSSVDIFNGIYAEMTLSGGTKYRRRITLIVGDGVSTGSVPDGAFSPESIALRLNDTGLDQIEPVITSLVDLDLATLMPVGTQVINEYCYSRIFGLCVGTADAYIASNSNPPSPSVGDFGIGIDSQPDHVDGRITLDDLFVRARVEDGNLGIGFTCHVNISAATSTIDGNYGLDPDAIDPTLIDVTQQGGVSVAFGNFNDSTDCSGIFGFVLEAFISLFVGSFENLMEDAFEDFLNTVDPQGNTPIASAIEVALEDVEIAGPIGDALGLTLDTQLFAVDEDAEGMTLGSDGAFTAVPVAAGTCHDEVTGQEIPGPIPCTTAMPCAVGQICRAGLGECVAPPEAPDFPASYDVAEAFPVLTGTTPGALPYGMGLCVSTSAFNQLLKAQMECGLLTETITELPGIGTLTGAVLAPFIPEIAMYPLTTEYELRVRPTTSAIITGNPGPGGELAELRAHALLVDLHDVAGQLPKLMTLSIDGTLGLDVAFVDGAMSFALGTPDPQTALAVTILLNRLGTDEQDLVDIVVGLFAVAIPELANALGAFPLPEFLGLQLSEVEVGRAGEFLSLYLDLSPAP